MNSTVFLASGEGKAPAIRRALAELAPRGDIAEIMDEIKV